MTGAISNAGTIEISGPASLLGEKLTNTASGSIVQIDDTLTLNGTEIVGGAIDGTGTIDITGASKIDGNATISTSNVTVESTTLTLDNVTVNGSTITEETTGSLIQIDSSDTLTLKGNATIQGASGVTGAISNAGTIEISGPASLLGEKLTNTASGSIVQVDSSQTLTMNGTEIVGGAIDGTGTIDVTGASKIDGNATLSTSNVIVESATLTLDNITVNGTITEETTGSLVHIDSSDTLTLKGGATIQGASGVTGAIDNAGTIDVSGPASLLGEKLTNTASGSIVQVDGSQTLTLNGTEITGGSIDGTGTIDITGASTIDGNATLSTVNVTIESTTLTLDNVTVNGSTITEETTGSLIQIDGSDTLTLKGNAIIQGASGVTGAIDNAGTIEISGPASLLGEKLTNTASGSIVQVDGSQTLTLSGTEIVGGAINGAGTIDVTGASKIDGNATLSTSKVTVESTTLTLDNVTVNGSTIIEETTGSLVQIDSTDTLTLKGGAILQGASGVVGAISNGGTIEISGPASLLGEKLTNTASGSIIQVDDTLTLNGTEIVGGSIDGTGTIDVTGASKVDGNATLSTSNVTVESTTLTLDNVTVNGSTITEETTGSLIQIDGSDTLTLKGSATIQGASGVTGAIDNAGTIDVSGPASLLGEKLTNTASGSIVQVDDTLTLNGTEIVGGAIDGTGTIDITGASKIDGNATLSTASVTVGGNVTLTLDNITVNGTSFDDTASGATIQIDGGDKLTLNGAGINGGTINAFTSVSVPTGSIVAADIDVTGSSGLSNVSLNHGHVTIESNVHLGFDNGTVTGTSFDDTASGATIDIAGTLTLNDVSINGGTVHNFSTVNPGGVIIGNTIDVNGDSTISNAQLNGGYVTLGGNAMLTLDGSTVTGTSFDDTASGATIQIDGNDTLTLSGAGINGGTIEATQAGATVQLENTTITGATLGTGDLTDGNSGLFQVEATSGANTSILDGSAAAVSVAGYVQVEAGANLELIGTIHNSGTIDIDGPVAASPTSLQISGTVTLDDGGTVTLDGPTDQIVAASGGGTLNNYETISGAGTIGHSGDGALTLHNEQGSVIEATGTLTIDTGATFTNDGTVEVNTGGNLVIDDVVAGSGSATINGGTLEIGAGATDAQTVTFNGAGTLQLDDPTSFTGEIKGLAAGDVIDLAGTNITSAIWNGSSLSVNGTPVGFSIDGLPNGDTFGFTSDGHDLVVLTQIETADSLPAQGVEGAPITLNFNDQIIPGSAPGAMLTQFVISGIPQGATIADAGGHALTITDGSVTLTQQQLADGVLTGLTITTDSDTDFSLSAVATATDANGYTYTVSPPDEVVTVDPQAPAVTWGGATSDTLIATEGTFSLHLLADAPNGLAADAGNTIQSVMLTGLAAGDTITDGTVADTVISTGTSETIDVTHWNLSGPLSVTTVNDTDFTLTAKVTEQDGDNPAQTSTAQAAEMVSVAPEQPTVTWGGTTADTLTATEGTFSLNLLAYAAHGLSGETGNTIQSVMLTGLAAGDTITDGTVADTVISTGTSETIDVTHWNLSGPLSVTANDTNFILTATVTEQDGDNPATTSTAQAGETVTVAAPAPELGGNTAATVNQGDLVTLGATDVAAFADDALGDVTITGFASDLTDFSGGTYTANTGTWIGTAAEFNALSFDAGAPGVSHLSISALTAGNSTPTTESYTLTVNSSIPPVVSFAQPYLESNSSSAAVGAVPTSNVGNGTDAITLDGWVNWNGGGDTSHNQILFYDGNTSYSGIGLYGTPTANGSLDLTILAGGAEGIDTGITLTAGQWYNLALSHANGIFTLDVNGAVVYTSGPEGAYAQGNHGAADYMLVGGNSGGAEGFSGGVANVSVWNTALSTSQVQTLESTTLSGSENNLAAYYPLNDGSGTIVTDVVSAAGNLTLSGSPVWQTSNSWSDAAVATTENHAVTINGLTVSDANAGTSQIEVTLTVADGTLEVGNTAGASFSGGLSGSVTLDGTLAEIDAALASGIVYTPNAGFIGSDSLTLVASDGGLTSNTEVVTLNVEALVDHWNGSTDNWSTGADWSMGTPPASATRRSSTLPAPTPSRSRAPQRRPA